MAVTRRGFIFVSFLLSVLGVLLIIIAIASSSWVVSTGTAQIQANDSIITYGLFRGELLLNTLGTPVPSTIFMTCLSDIGYCGLSCKTEASAREEEIRALANLQRPNPVCQGHTTIDEGSLDEVPLISFAFYVSLLVILFFQLVGGLVSAALAIINAITNPTEPVFGLPGCLWSNVITTIFGLTGMIMFGVYWSTSGLRDHLAFSYVSTGFFIPGSGLGFSYWLLILALVCPIINIGLIEIRRYLLERDPPPPIIKVEDGVHSDGTIFLY